MMIKEEKSIMKEFKIFGGGGRYLLFKYCTSKEERRCANLISGPSGDCV